MKAHSILFGSFIPSALLAVGSALLITPAAQAQTVTVLHTYTENFDGMTANSDFSSTLHGKSGWSVNTDNNPPAINNAVLPLGSGNNGAMLVGNRYAAHSINQSYASEVNALVFSWTERALASAERPAGTSFNNNLVAGAALYSGANAYTTTFLSIDMQRTEATDWKPRMRYTEWDPTVGEKGGNVWRVVSNVAADEGSFVVSNSITYAFEVRVDLDAHTYSFTISNAADASIIWSSPDAIAINPDLDLPQWLRLQVHGGNAGGAMFDNVVFQQLHVTAVPEPATFAMMAGAALLGFAVVRRRR